MSPPSGPVRPLPCPADLPYPELALIPRLERLRHDFAVAWAAGEADCERYAFWFAWLAQEIAEGFAVLSGASVNLVEIYQRRSRLSTRSPDEAVHRT